MKYHQNHRSFNGVVGVFLVVIDDLTDQKMSRLYIFIENLFTIKKMNKE